MRIVTRAEWGAQAPRASMAVMRYPARELWVHHSVTNPTGDPYADARAIQKIGFSRGFSDISYSFLVHPNGTIMEGRDLRYVGAHTSGHNSVSLAVCLIGNYENGPPSQAQIDAIRWLRDHLVATGKLVGGKVYPTGGHRDTKATACPGRHAYAAIPAMREPQAAPPGPAPAPTPPPAPGGHAHDEPLVKFDDGAPGRPASEVHGAVQRPNGTWVWQLDYRNAFWEVRDIQQHMREQGHDASLIVDGVGGPTTLRHLKAYQAARGLTADGYVGRETWAWLHGRRR